MREWLEEIIWDDCHNRTEAINLTEKIMAEINKRIPERTLDVNLIGGGPDLFLRGINEGISKTAKSLGLNIK